MTARKTVKELWQKARSAWDKGLNRMYWDGQMDALGAAEEAMDAQDAEIETALASLSSLQPCASLKGEGWSYVVDNPGPWGGGVPGHWTFTDTDGIQEVEPLCWVPLPVLETLIRGGAQVIKAAKEGS